MLAKHVVAAIAVGLAAVGCSVSNPSTPTPPPMSVQVQRGTAAPSRASKRWSLLAMRWRRQTRMRT